MIRSTLLAIVVALSGAGTALSAFAAEPAASKSAKARVLLKGEQLQQALLKANCLTCHATDRTLVGPSFVAVNKKYRKRPALEEALAQKVRQGGRGVWGVVPMPANLQLSEEESLLLVRSLLAKDAFTAP